MIGDTEYESVHFRIKTTNTNLSPICMTGCAIFVNIVNSLGHDVNYNQEMVEDGHKVDIIYNGSKYLQKVDNKSFNFDKTEVIKYSNIEHLRQADK